MKRGSYLWPKLNIECKYLKIIVVKLLWYSPKPSIFQPLPKYYAGACAGFWKDGV